MHSHKLHITRSAILIVASSAFLAFDSLNTSWRDHPCYAQAMIGYDSVINARLGVPAEHALDLAAHVQDQLSKENTYSSEILKIILTAYLWNESPHDYSRKVFYRCTLSNRAPTDPDLIGRVGMDAKRRP